MQKFTELSPNIWILIHIDKSNFLINKINVKFDGYIFEFLFF